MNRFLRVCRTTHSWLGALVMPWVLIIGATGLFLNHSQLVLRLLRQTDWSDSEPIGLPEVTVTDELAHRIAGLVWPDQLVLESGFIKYQGQKAYALKKDSGLIIFPRAQSNHYIVKTNLTENVYAMDGKLIHRQYDLKRIFKSLHERGWVGSRFGTWLADMVAAAMVFFGISGLIMWSVPKARKLRVWWWTKRFQPNANQHL
jgi:hypothetical protein